MNPKQQEYIDLLPGKTVKLKLGIRISTEKLQELFAWRTLDQTY
ncbi:MAG: hypothetical protein WC384_07940 [Prolixibacteraceae bacterium]|jgi:hypothetical protein